MAIFALEGMVENGQIRLREKAAEITKADVIDVLDHIAYDRGSVIQANRTRALIHKIFTFAMTRDILQANPCSGLPKPGKECRLSMGSGAAIIRGHDDQFSKRFDCSTRLGGPPALRLGSR